MATKVFMEALSPTMEEGRLVKWLKNEGDAVKSGEPLAEVETDKAIMELVARGDGVLRKRLLAEGESSPVGKLVGVIATKDENIDALLQTSDVKASQTSDVGRQTAETKQPEKASTGATSVARAAQQSQGEASTPPQEKTATTPTSDVRRPTSDAGNGGRAKSSPLARRMASEKGVDIGSLQGSGPGGRIIKRDIENIQTSDDRRQTSAAPAPRSGNDFDDIPLTQIRKTIAKRLSESI